jgi:hypothetical protein
MSALDGTIGAESTRTGVSEAREANRHHVSGGGPPVVMIQSRTFNHSIHPEV